MDNGDYIDVETSLAGSISTMISQIHVPGHDSRKRWTSEYTQYVIDYILKETGVLLIEGRDKSKRMKIIDIDKLFEWRMSNEL